MPSSDTRAVTEGKSISWATGSSPDSTSSRLCQRWQQMFSASHLPWSVTVDYDAGGPTGSHTCKFWRLDDLMLVDCVCDPCRGVRTSSQLNATDGEFAVLVLVSSGSETLHQRGADLELRSGDAFVWDSTLPARFHIHKRLRKRSLVVPHALLEVTGRGRFAGPVRLDCGSAAVQLLISYVRSLSRTSAALDGRAAISARNASVELLIGALRAGDVPTTKVTHQALRDQMVRYIDDRLSSGEITAAVLAAASCISERTVHRIFNESGETVGDVVRRHRLARARQDVIGSNLSLSTIAHRWGYADLSHFTRSFKARYGQPPSHLRAQVS